MPVQIQTASHDARPVPAHYAPLNDPNDLLKQTWGGVDPQGGAPNIYEALLRSSFNGQNLHNVVPRRNGFVDTVVEAYNKHHHLVLRPDDIWMAILGQFNCYVNAHAEDLRSHFVPHAGKKTLKVSGTGLWNLDYGKMARKMTEKIHENVVDKGLKAWILPDFTTTTHHDTVVAAIIMMATLKAYFDYVFEWDCGIPSITIEGQKEDWAKILTRLDKFQTFGEEPAAWATMLRPIIKRFVDAFDGEPDVDFWKRICHYGAGSGGASISGWLVAFCYWDADGKCTAPLDENRKSHAQLEVDGVPYHGVDAAKVAVGFCEVDILVNECECMMVAGHVASVVEGEKMDVLRPLSGWFAFVKWGCEVPDLSVEDGKDIGDSDTRRRKWKSWIEKIKAFWDKLAPLQYCMCMSGRDI